MAGARWHYFNAFDLRGGGSRSGATASLFIQVILAKLYGDRIGHDLVAMNLRPLPPGDLGVPAHLRIAVNSNQKIARRSAIS
jgi:hypothetical protein